MSSSQTQSYSVSYDSTSKIISTFVCVILAGVAIAAHSVVATVLAGLILVGCYAYSPAGYLLSDRTIIVKRLIGNVRIPLDNLREVRVANEADFEGGIRLFGNGGVFGYYGLFRTSKLGKCYWYITDRSKSVLVITAAKTALFSPNEVDAFVAALRPLLSSGSVAVPPPPAARGFNFGRLIPKLIAAIVGVTGMTFGIFALIYSPGPPSYTLTANSLTIHDRFYPVTVNAAAVDVGRVRVVDFGVESDWHPTERTNGFANSHYHSGWFRLASGKVVRLYRADGQRLVLLPPKGGGNAVLLEAKEPEKLVEQVRQEWLTRS